MRKESKTEELINSMQTLIENQSKECEALTEKYVPLYNSFVELQAKFTKMEASFNELNTEKDLWHSRCIELYSMELTLKNKITFLERHAETTKKDVHILLERDKKFTIQLNKIPDWVKWIFGCTVE